MPLSWQSHAARRAGVDLTVYEAHFAVGEDWCAGCCAWHPIEDFRRDPSRASGRRPQCRAHRRHEFAEQNQRPVCDTIETGPLASELTLAYLAGMLDADGYISIQRNQTTLASGRKRSYYIAHTGLGQITQMGPQLLYDTFGGSLSFYTPPNPKHVPRWIWHATNTIAARAALQLLPHLRLKSRQAGIAIAFARRLDSNRGWRVSDDEEAIRHGLFEEIRALNRPRSGPRAKQLGGARPGNRLEDLPEDLRIRQFPGQLSLEAASMTRGET